MRVVVFTCRVRVVIVRVGVVVFRVRVVVCTVRNSVLRVVGRRERFKGLGRGDRERKCYS